MSWATAVVIGAAVVGLVVGGYTLATDESLHPKRERLADDFRTRSFGEFFLRLFLPVVHVAFVAAGVVMIVVVVVGAGVWIVSWLSGKGDPF